MDRRTFLRRAGGAGASAALGLLAAACSSPTTAVKRADATSTSLKGARTGAGVHEVNGLQVADWVVEENRHPGRTRDWIIRKSVPSYLGVTPPIEGYLDRVSATAGDEVSLFVNTTSPTFRAYFYRIGYYDGFGGRRVALSPELPGKTQPPPTFTGDGVNLVECRWTPSWKFTVGSDWPTGYYLIRLEGSSGRAVQRYVPLLVRDDASRASYLVQSSVTTWQAYNPYGGYSLYGGPGGDSYANRSRIVSFDRPYGHDETALDARGSGDFLGNELPFVFLAEQNGLDLGYWTDVDLHEQPALLAKHRCLISLGHDEYWSKRMRDAVSGAIEHGLNVAFLGANACYRQIRFAKSASGLADRRVICYKDAGEDPITATDPALSTANSWASPPTYAPESSLIGVMYQSYGAQGPLVIKDPAAFVFKGTGLAEDAELPNLIGSEFDGFEPRSAQPPGPVQILAHSPTGPATVNGASYSDMSYYALPGKGAVFATGTAAWVTNLWDGPARTRNRLGLGVNNDAVEALARITLNVLGAFGAGPAGRSHPSVANWQRFYLPNAPKKSAVDVP